MSKGDLVGAVLLGSILLDWFLRGRLRGDSRSAARAAAFAVLAVVFLAMGVWAAAGIAVVGAVGFAFFARGFDLPVWGWFAFAVATFAAGLYYHDWYLLMTAAVLCVLLLLARLVEGWPRSRR